MKSSTVADPLMTDDRLVGMVQYIRNVFGKGGGMLPGSYRGFESCMSLGALPRPPAGIQPQAQRPEDTGRVSMSLKCHPGARPDFIVETFDYHHHDVGQNPT